MAIHHKERGDAMSLFKRNIQTSTAWNEYAAYENFDGLPDATAQPGETVVVLNASGVWFINYREAGLYRSNGVVWQYVGSQVETTSIKVDNSTVVGAPITLNAGANINLTVDLPTKTITISATGTGTGTGSSVYFPQGW
jgi:hypothetical protein